MHAVTELTHCQRHQNIFVKSYCQHAPVHVRPSLHEYRITTLILRLSEIGQKSKHILATTEPDGNVASESIMSG